MGLFSKIKNTLTGGWADVRCTAGPGRRGESLDVQVDVHVKADAIDVKDIYVQIECREVVDIPNYHVPGMNRGDSMHNSNRVHVHERNTLWTHKLSAGQGLTLEGGSQNSYQVRFDLPSQWPASWSGRYCRLEWAVLAGLDMKGNDPDSGWQVVTVE